MASEFSKTSLNRVRQKSSRAHYDRDTIYPIVDEALYCHVGIVQDSQPLVIPTIHGRDGDLLYFHGGRGSRLLAHMQEGHPICVTVTLLDGIVFARSVFHHSLNYRSAVLFGTGNVVESEREKLHALEILTEHVARGRWADARKPSQIELDATAVVRMQIQSASAKVRTGPPIDDREDIQLPVWAGVLPFALQPLSSEPDPTMREGIPPPDYITVYRRNRASGV